MPDGKDDMMSQGIGSFVKAVGGQMGRLATDVIAGRQTGEKLYAEKQQTTQAELKEQFSQRVANGELIDLESRRAWGAAGGDDSVIGAMNQSAIHNLKERGEAENYITAQHGAGIYDDNEANLYTTMIRSDNPTIQEIGHAVLSSQAKQQQEFMKYMFGTEIQKQKDTAAGERNEAKIGAEKDIAGARDDNAMKRTAYHEKMATKRTELMAAARGKAAGTKAPAFTQGGITPAEALKAITTGKTTDADGLAHPINPKQREAYAGLANSNMIAKGAKQVDMLKQGLLTYKDPETGEMSAAGGLNGLGDAIVDTKQRAAYDSAVKKLLSPDSSPEARQGAFTQILALIPEDQRQGVAQQIMRMMQDSAEAQANAEPSDDSDDVEGADSEGETLKPPTPLSDDDGD